MAMTLCKHCDSWVDERNEYCPICGHRLWEGYNSPISPYDGGNGGNKDSQTKWALIIGVEIAVAIAIVVVILFSYHIKDERKQADLKKAQIEHRGKAAEAEAKDAEKRERMRVEAEKKASADRSSAFYGGMPKATNIMLTEDYYTFLKSPSQLRKFFRSKGYTLVKEVTDIPYRVPDYGVSAYSYWKYRLALIDDNRETAYCEATVYDGYSVALSLMFSSSSLTKNFINSVKSYVGKSYHNPYWISNNLEMVVSGNTVTFYPSY